MALFRLVAPRPANGDSAAKPDTEEPGTVDLGAFRYRRSKTESFTVDEEPSRARDNDATEVMDEAVCVVCRE